MNENWGSPSPAHSPLTAWAPTCVPALSRTEEAQRGQLGQREVEASLEQILSRQEFRDEPSYVENLLADFAGWLSELFEGMGVDVEPSTIQAWAEGVWLTIAVLCGVILIWFWISIAKSQRAREERPADLSDIVAERVAALRERAKQAQEAQDFTRALRLYFFALVVGLGERGELDYSDAWTNRELLERGEPKASIAALLRPLVGELDEHSFGRRPVDLDEVQRFAGLCQQYLGDPST